MRIIKRVAYVTTLFILMLLLVVPTLKDLRNTNGGIKSKNYQNIAIDGGSLWKEVNNLPSVKHLIEQGLRALITHDATFIPGTTFTSYYRMSSITGGDGRRIFTQALKDLYQWKFLDNNFFSAENFLGSFGFSMRVTGQHTIVYAVYDSKSGASLTDHRSSLGSMASHYGTTYQRYIYTIPY